MADPARTCPHCGSSMVEYRHSLSQGLLVTLFRLYQARRPTSLRTLRLTRSQWDNAQKLRYWDLIARYTPPGETPKAKGGVWTITEKGIDFVRDQISVPKSVYTYRGERTRYDEASFVKVGELDPGWKLRPDYAREAVPCGPIEKDEAGQMTLW